MVAGRWAGRDRIRRRDGSLIPVSHMRGCGSLAWLPGLILVSFLTCFPALSSASEDATARTHELNELRTRIQDMQTRLDAKRKEKTREEKTLRSIDRNINTTRQALQQTENQLRSVRKQLTALQQQQKAETRQLGVQREQLVQEVRSAYAMGRQKQVKLLLNQEQPGAVGRMLTYFGYFTRARAEKIDALKAVLMRLQILQSDIEKKTETLAELHSNQKSRVTRLAEQKRLRAQAVADLKQQLAKQGSALKQLQADEARLQELVHSLQELLADIPADAGQNRPFKTLKGSLSWPARGQLSEPFGTPRGDGGLTWQGVLISAPEGGKVQAVAQGRVAFADWMRGFGLLLIIDHGDGYMSLYGHNQALYKEVGEWVDTGEMIATLGASGGQSQSGLYFELRHKGRPVNPRKWCRGKPSRTSG